MVQCALYQFQVASLPQELGAEVVVAAQSNLLTLTVENPQPATVCVEQNSDNRVWKNCRGVPLSNACLVGTTSVRQLEFGMRLIGNYSSEWPDTRGNTPHTLLITLVACAVGATASAAVIFSLASSTTTQRDVPSISPQAIVRDARASEVPKTAQVGTPSPGAIVQNAGASEVPKAAQDGPVEPTPRPATRTASGRDEPVTQTEAVQQTEAQSQQSRKHGRVARRWREPYWRRFAHNSSPRPFGFW
jgi:hypothetical protein